SKGKSGRVPHALRRLAYRLPPLLIPAGMAAGVTAAMASPALDAVKTAPGGSFNNVDLVGRRMPFEIFAIVCQLRQLIRLDGVQGVGESHVAEAVVMAVTFTVCSDMDELRPVTRVTKRADEPIGQMLAVGE